VPEQMKRPRRSGRRILSLANPTPAPVGILTAKKGYARVQVTRAQRTDKPRARKPRAKSALRPRTFRMPNIKISITPSKKATSGDMLTAVRALLAQLEAESADAA